MGVAEALIEDTCIAGRAYRTIGAYIPDFTKYDFFQRFFSDTEFRRGSLHCITVLDKIESIECESDPSYAPLCFEFRKVVEKIKNQ
jgi:hypothetical protein